VDWTLTPAGLAVAAPDCFALDGRDGALRFTLVRSPVYAWHDPAKLEPQGHYRHTDQGEHYFRFRLWPDATPEVAGMAALSLHDVPVCLDWTRGMGR
jgi:alpha-mannosidase